MLLRSFFVFCSFFILSIGSTSADSLTQLEQVLQEYKIEHQTKNYLGNTFEINLSNFDQSLGENFSDTPLEYVWEVFSSQPQNGPKLSTSFETVGEKAIQLNIFTSSINDLGEIEKKLLYSYDTSIFVYAKSIALLTSNSIDQDTISDYIDAGEDLGIYIYHVGNVSEGELDGQNIVSSLSGYQLSFPEKSNYLVVWGEKEFLFSTLSQLRASNLEKEALNVVLVSSYNSSTLKNYISNSIAGKDFINNGFIIDESLRFQILKNPKDISSLQKEIETNNYNYTSITDNVEISPAFFISRFINELSNSGISTSNIYIILLLPLFLTIVGVSKHLIGISTLGSIIPVFITLLYIQAGIIFTIILMGFLVIFNILISKYINKYTLLYTPKVTFITILNILVFILFYQFMAYYNLPYIHIENILYIILFFIVSEKLITIIASKEFREYKKSLSGTLVVSFICYALYQLDTLLVFLTAYPEVLICLVPLNFLLGRFTGLRFTEYLRFREIIKSIEE